MAWTIFHGKVKDTEADAYRSGAFDSFYRLSMNIMGGQAMDLQDFRKWRQHKILGLSAKVSAPTGQYDSTRLINFGTNRSAFKLLL
jgi:hypothetical protein